MSEDKTKDTWQREIQNATNNSFMAGFAISSVIFILIALLILAVRADIIAVSYPDRNERCYYNRKNSSIESCFLTTPTPLESNK